MSTDRSRGGTEPRVAETRRHAAEPGDDVGRPLRRRRVRPIRLRTRVLLVPRRPDPPRSTHRGRRRRQGRFSSSRPTSSTTSSTPLTHEVPRATPPASSTPSRALKRAPRRSSSCRAQQNPSPASTLKARPKPFSFRAFRHRRWSIYGAKRARPVATGGKWDGAKTALTSDNRCRGLRPVADRIAWRRRSIAGSFAADPFTTAYRVNLDSSGLEATRGDWRGQTAGGLSPTLSCRKSLQTRPFLVSTSLT
jgi:hypothetical protein